MKMNKVLFARIGYMKKYAGPQPGDLKPIGGGSYNETKVGHEAFNFKDIDGIHYGYFQPTVKRNFADSTVDLNRIERGSAGQENVEGVTIIFFATHPVDRSAVVVGWYKNATVYHDYQHVTGRLASRRQNFNFNLKCASKDAYLLDDEDRFILYKTGGGYPKVGKPGQANAFYLLDSRGSPKSDLARLSPWVSKALTRIGKYRGGPSSSGPDLETATLKELHQGSGQGRQLDAKARKAIETRAMESAKAYYKGKRYKVADVSLHQPYDLECRIRRRVLRVEVKGTTTKGATVLLTRNEVKSARAHPTELYVLHSIKLKREDEPVATGGIRRILAANWAPLDEQLTPTAFEFALPRLNR
jgi:Domain of unknown function (DUF3883)